MRVRSTLKTPKREATITVAAKALRRFKVTLADGHWRVMTDAHIFSVCDHLHDLWVDGRLISMPVKIETID